MLQIFTKNSGARRLARTIETATGDTTDESSTEFSEDDLKKLKIELEKQLPSPYVERISGVLAKFTKDNPIELRMEGVVCYFRFERDSANSN